ncbi:MAG: glycosyltransferase family 4 protein [Pseudomonadota bacterium]
MKIAVVCPDDLSIVLFCKGIIDTVRTYDNSEVFVVCDVYGEGTNGQYTEVIKSWGVMPVPLKMNRHISLFEDLKYSYSLYKIFRNNKIDIVINISTKPNIYGTIAARCAKAKKILCSVWGRGTTFADNAGLKISLLKYLLLILYFIAFRLSSKVWFTNTNDYNYFVSNNIVPKNKTILSKNYVSTDDYLPYSLSNEKLLNYKSEFKLGDNDKVVIMVARMIWAKGVGEFAEAAKILKDRLPFVKFILVGSKETTSPDAVPEMYLKDTEKEANFIWIGFRNDVKDLYALSDVAVLPSYYREGGYPRALTEPMAMGKPVIAADSIDCRAPVENGRNGYLVPIKDSKALAEAIETLMTDEKKREEFGRYSRIKAETEYDEKVIVRQVIETFWEK